MVAETLAYDFYDSSKRSLCAAFKLYPSFTEHVAAGIRMVKMDEFLEIPVGSPDFSHQVLRNLHRTSFGDDNGIRAVMSEREREFAADVVDLCENLNRHNERLDAFARACEARPYEFVDNEDKLWARQNRLISERIEENCQPLVHRILQNGGWTLWSNGYGGGYKGVFWRKDGTVHFTSLANSHTYADATLALASAQGLDDFYLEEHQKVEIDFDVSDLMPEGCDSDVPIECFYR